MMLFYLVHVCSSPHELIVHMYNEAKHNITNNHRQGPYLFHQSTLQYSTRRKFYALSLLWDDQTGLFEALN